MDLTSRGNLSSTKIPLESRRASSFLYKCYELSGRLANTLVIFERLTFESDEKSRFFGGLFIESSRSLQIQIQRVDLFSLKLLLNSPVKLLAKLRSQTSQLDNNLQIWIPGFGSACMHSDYSLAPGRQGQIWASTLSNGCRVV